MTSLPFARHDDAAAGPAAAPTRRFRALDLATDAALVVIAACRRVPAPLRALADQALRAATSVPLNIAEGSGRSGRDRVHHYRIAYASAREADVALRLLVAAGAFPRDDAARALDALDQARAILWRLTR